MWSWGNHHDNHHHHHHQQQHHHHQRHHHSSIYCYIFQKSFIFHRLQFQLTNLWSFFFHLFVFFVYTCISVYSKTHLLSVLCIEKSTPPGIKLDTIKTILVLAIMLVHVLVLVVNKYIYIDLYVNYYIFSLDFIHTFNWTQLWSVIHTIIIHSDINWHFSLL